ncbi:MAG: hypothetical protein L6R19_07650 [Alphaproteobacteria bacterium]|nr:hypothetical protein [Alphaproteobacteria bacterium]
MTRPSFRRSLGAAAIGAGCLLAPWNGPALGQSGLPTLPGQAPAGQPTPQAQPQAQPQPAPLQAAPRPPGVQPQAQPQPQPHPTAQPPAAAAGAFDQTPERPVADVYPPEQRESPQHTLVDPVRPSPSPTALGLWNQTSIQSRYGNLETPNESFTRIRIREIEAITKLKAIDTGETVGGGVANAAMAPVRAVGALFTKPVETLGNIPKGVGDFIARTGEGFSSEKSKFEDGMFKEIAGVSRKKREIAAQMGVDVYSSNPLLQEELDRVGIASAGGNITVDVGMIAVTGTAGAIISNLGRVDALQEIVNTQPASELRRRARHTLEVIAMPKSFIDQFLDHPYYSPRRKTIIVGLMSPMKEVRGLEQFMEAALTAGSEADALYYQQMMELFSAFHFNVAPLKQILLIEKYPVAISEKAGAFFSVPVDRVYWTKETQGFLDQLLAKLPDRQKLPAVTMWALGDYTPLAAAEVAKRGIRAGQKAAVNYN